MHDLDARSRPAVLRDDLAFDIGLHRGEDTAYLLRKGYRVVAFEANGDLVRECAARFADAIAAGRLRIVEGAIAPEAADDHVTFWRNASISEWGTTAPDMAERNARLGAPSIEVRVRRVDLAAVIAEEGVPDLAKIDIENGEGTVLELFEALPVRPRLLSHETSTARWREVVAEVSRLRAMGYTRFRFVPQMWNGHARVAGRGLDGMGFEHVSEPGSSGPMGDDLAQPWLDAEGALRRFRPRHLRSALFGDGSPLHDSPLTRWLPALGQRVLGKGAKNWFDLHAAR